MRITIALCLILACVVDMPLASAGKLSRARDEVRGSSKSKDDDEDDDKKTSSSSSGKLSKARDEVRSPSHPSGGRGGSYHHPPKQSSTAGFFGFFSFSDPAPRETVYVVSEPAQVIEYSGTPVIYQDPYMPALCDDYQLMFPPHPYADGAEGFMKQLTPNIHTSWLGRAQVELGDDFDGLHRTGVALNLEHINRFGFDFDWNTFNEDLDGGGHDELHLGELDVLYRIVEGESALVRVGIGTAWLGDTHDTDFGINFTVKGDLAPVKPFILSTEFDIGTIGGAEHLHLSGSIGAMIYERCEFYGGYDYHRIGDVELDGPLLGLRIWF